MTDAAEISDALKRACMQYGPQNVDLTVPFLKLLSIKTFNGDEVLAKQAYVAPLEEGSLTIDISNVQWALPEQNLSRSAHLKKVKALNAVRKNLGFDPIESKSDKTKFARGITKKRLVALAIAKYFFAKREVNDYSLFWKDEQSLTKDEQAQLADLYNFANQTYFNMFNSSIS